AACATPASRREARRSSGLGQLSSDPSTVAENASVRRLPDADPVDSRHHPRRTLTWSSTTDGRAEASKRAERLRRLNAAEPRSAQRRKRLRQLVPIRDPVVRQRFEFQHTELLVQRTNALCQQADALEIGDHTSKQELRERFAALGIA